MATIEKRGNSYRITVSCGYNSENKQIKKAHDVDTKAEYDAAAN